MKQIKKKSRKIAVKSSEIDGKARSLNPNEINGYLTIPFSLICSGCSGAGKSHFVKNLLLNQRAITGGTWKKIFYISRFELTDLERDLKHLPVEFIHGVIPTVDELQDKSDAKHQNLVILDDLMTQAANSADVKNLFAEGRHIKFSVIYCTQNLFQRGLFSREIRLNSNYLVLFKQIHDRLQLIRFFVSVRPGFWRFMLNCYDDAIGGHFGYFLMDFRPHSSSDILRLRTDIRKNSQILYIEGDSEYIKAIK